MVVIVVLHMIQVVWAGAYRAPREFNWWIGLGLGGLVLAFALTGYLLPWDQKGYWATQVATGILGTVPAGEIAQQLLQGGSEYGNLTLTRFYAVHVFVLPLSLAGALGLHIYLFRRHGVTPPAGLSESELEKSKQPFWPNQLFLDVMAMVMTGVVLLLLTMKTHGAELYAPADPASSFVARPEWYFLFLFQLLKYFDGPFAIMGTVVIPGAVATFLFALPFIDRAQSRRPKERMPVLTGVATLMAGVVALTMIAVSHDAQDEEFAKGLKHAHEQAHKARELALEGVPPRGGTAVWENDPLFRARTVFRENCATCHTFEARGGEEAPTLDDFTSREWMMTAVRDPRSTLYFGGTKDHDDMEAYPVEDLGDEQLADVVEYLLSLRSGGIEVDAKMVARGKVLWEDELDCNGGHGIEAGVDGEGAPVFSGRGSVAWVERVIRDSSQIDLYGEEAEMPKFESKLSKSDIEALAAMITGTPMENDESKEAK
jgi:ubiquinol-cytochrome c reductase cytochrome b subunit